MDEDTAKVESFTLPDDLHEKVLELASSTQESPRFLIIAAVEHFLRIPENQRKAVLKGTSMRRRGW